MLAGIFYGAMYGGSTTSILVRIPGEAASVITCIDGYEMARKGRAGPALMIAAVGSFVGGTLSILGLMFFAPPLAKAMIAVGPSVQFLLMLLALAVISRRLGRLAAQDRDHGRARTCCSAPSASTSSPACRASPSAAPTSPTAFVCGARDRPVRPLRDPPEPGTDRTIKAIAPKLRELVPRWKDLRESAPAIARGSAIGFVFGDHSGREPRRLDLRLLRGREALLQHPEEFGKGAIAGVAGPETANNATTGTAMIPLLALGIPSIPATAILLSALTIHGVQPGPLLLTDHPEVFWGLVASMYIGNVILLILNLPLVGLFVNLLRIPTRGWCRSSWSSRSSASTA